MSDLPKATALILAGTRPGGDPLANAMGMAHKSLIEIGGKPMLSRVIEAVRDAQITEIVVSTDCEPVAVLAKDCGALVRTSLSGPSATVAAAFDEFGAPMIVTTADHALLRAEWVGDLVRKTDRSADVAIMMAERGAIEAAVPATQRTYLKMADGAWSGCNLFYLQAAEARRAIDQWQAIEADRKRPWKIAGKLGLSTMLSYAAGRLSMADAVTKIGGRMGISAQLVPASDGRAAIDVDKPADIDLVRQILGDGA